MKGWQRWLVVALGVLLLGSIPPVLAALPATESDASAAELLAAVRESDAVAFSGYAEAVGGLVLPVTEDFTDLVDLFGERARLRAWWAGPDDWRVDQLTATGETGVFHRTGASVLWDYEDSSATLAADAVVRLPRAADLLPSVLGQRLLSEAVDEEVSRLPAERIAGRDALGLRLVPSDERTTIDRVDVWVDPSTGVPLKVEVYGAGASVPAVRSRFLEFTPGAPDPSATGFVTPPGVDLAFTEVIDVAEAANQFAPAATPDELAGLTRRSGLTSIGSLGQYGRGVTLLTAAPVWDRLSRPLRDQLEGTPGAVVDENGVYLSAGPIGVLLTPGSRERSSWLIAGTVDAATLAAAAAEVRQIPVPDQ